MRPSRKSSRAASQLGETQGAIGAEQAQVPAQPEIDPLLLPNLKMFERDYLVPAMALHAERAAREFTVEFEKLGGFAKDSV